MFVKEMFQLEKVLGLTVDSNRGLVSSCKTDLIAYSAGSTVVLTNSAGNNQRHIINHSKKGITGLAFSPSGELLFTCEYGQNSSIKIWSVQGNLEQKGEIVPDENRTRCFAVSPDRNFIVTIGHNFTLSLWDWRKKLKVTGGKVSYQIAGVSFAENGKYFVTAGYKHLKYWYWDDTNLLSPKNVEAIDRSNLDYFDLRCGWGKCCKYTYAVTSDGILYMFNDQRLLEKWVELERSVNCLLVTEKFVFLGCDEAEIYCFDSLTLKFMYNLPKCHVLGVDIKDGSSMGYKREGSKHPDTIAMTFNQVTNSFIAIYNDHSLYGWNLQSGGDTITKNHSFFCHSNCVWDLKMDITEEETRFYTCSSDNTIRRWAVDGSYPESIEYVDGNCSYLKEVTVSRNPKVDYGMRSLAISSDGKYLACGDRKGIIRIYELPDIKFCLELEEHNLEILSLDYTPSNSNHNLLASAGKDKQIYIFKASNNYRTIQKLKNHTSSVITVKFAVSTDGNLIMASATSDGTCTIRSIRSRNPDTISVVEEYSVFLKRVLYSMEISGNAKYAFMACQSLKILNVDSRDIVKTLKPASKGAFVFKIALDPNARYLCASCLDKSILVYDFNTGNHLATMHSNLVTSLCFTPDHRRLVAVTGDSCIFISKISDQNRFSRGNFYSSPLWAKESFSKSTDIIISDRSVIPRGKWANRMEPTISIRASYTSEDSEASLQTPLSSHSDVFQYITVAESENQVEENVDTDKYKLGTATETNLDPKAPIPPQRRRRKTNMATEITNSKCSASRSTGDASSKIPVLKESNTTQKQEKVSRMIGEVKEKLQNIGQTNRMKSSKSMSNLSEPPPKGSWLLQYRASLGEQKNQLRKEKSVSNLANSKYYSNENLNQRGSIATNKSGRNELSKANDKIGSHEKAKSYIKKESSLSSTTNKYKPKLSLPKLDLLARTHTDPEIMIRKMQNENSQPEESGYGGKFDKKVNNRGNDISKPRKKQRISNVNKLTPHYLERTQTDPDIVFRRKPKDNVG